MISVLFCAWEDGGKFGLTEIIPLICTLAILGPVSRVFPILNLSLVHHGKAVSWLMASWLQHSCLPQ